jgi:hypothetical protein
MQVKFGRASRGQLAQPVQRACRGGPESIFARSEQCSANLPSSDYGRTRDSGVIDVIMVQRGENGTAAFPVRSDWVRRCWSYALASSKGTKTDKPLQNTGRKCEEGT